MQHDVFKYKIIIRCERFRIHVYGVVSPLKVNSVLSHHNKKVLVRSEGRWEVTRGGVPPCRGIPPARSDGGYPRWGKPPPTRVIPPTRSGEGGGTQGRVRPTHKGNPPNQVWGRGVPEVGYPPPQPGLTGGYLRWGTTPPPPPGVDRHVSKHNLPVVLQIPS